VLYDMSVAGVRVVEFGTNGQIPSLRPGLRHFSAQNLVADLVALVEFGPNPSDGFLYIL